MQSQSSGSSRHLAHVHGADLHWIDVGVGRPTVLLHGLADSHRTWRHLAPQLGARRLLMLDLPGHGLSCRPDASYSLAWHAELVGAWMDSLGLDEVDLLGHSYGGGVAQWLLLKHGSRIRRLALLAPGGLGRRVGLGVKLATLGIVEACGQPFMGIGTALGMRRLGIVDRDDIEQVRWMNTAPGTARALHRTARGVVGLGGQTMQMFDRISEVAQMPPTALFWGDRDPIIPFAHGERMRERFDGVRLIRFAGVGHFPHQERPIELATAMREFLDEAVVERPRIRRVLARGAAPRAGWLRRFFRSIAAGVRRAFGVERLAA